MKQMNFHRYRPFPEIDLPDRQWPSQRITQAPVWCSVDLRDGNQALSIPMSLDEKLEMFQLLVNIGFKEIEVGFPSAAEVEYQFLRTLIDDELIPDDVTVQVLTQSREHLIKRSFEALEGAKNAIVHLYNSTSTLQREVVFRMEREEITKIAVAGAEQMKALREEYKNPGIRFQYSPESFTGTELDFALDISHAVMGVWQPTPEWKAILNLPATVEMSTPNIHADQIEWMCRNLDNRENILVSLHTHNDRGTGVAASELALMAGADRVEGTLFGNGERTGNLDITIMALNMFSQGVDPKLDFTDINAIRDTYMRCTRLPVHPRHPYVGELVYTAFSGSHQDAIKKGMEANKEATSGVYEVPYMPIDPKDVGRTYESIIRINSQSGKGGVAYIMDREFGFKLPKKMHPEFGKAVQQVTDKTGDELSPTAIRDIFEKEYLARTTPYALKKCRIDMSAGENGADSGATIQATITVDGKELEFESNGNGPIDAFAAGLKKAAGVDFTVTSYDEHAIEHGSNAEAAAYVALTSNNATVYGAGTDANINTATIRAMLSALNRLS